MTGVRAAGAGRKPGDGKALPAAADSERLLSIDTPEDLRDDVAVKMWETQSQVLIERGVLTVADAGTLLVYCNSFSMYMQAEKEISKVGLVVSTGEGGTKKNPAVNVRQDAASTLARMGSLLGLDPLSRTKLLGGGPGAGSGENEFNGY